MELAWIDETDGQAAADALVAVRARLLEAEATEFVLAAHWVDLHAPETVAPGVDRAATQAAKGERGAGARALPGLERVRQYGGDGTPAAGEFAAAELGALTGRGPEAAATLMADAVDVRHRLPRSWAGVVAGEVPVWKARKLAARTREVGLSLEQARWADGQISPYLGSMPWGRLLRLLEAKIVEVDPGAAEARRKAAAMERFVSTGQCNEYGLKTVIAQADAGDAIFFTAMCDRIAQILLLRGDTDPVGARRSKALGILASPGRATLLLAEYEGRGAPADRPAQHADHGADDSDDSDHSAGSGDSPEPSAFVRALATIDPRKLLPAVTLYVHMSREDLDAATGRAPADGCPGTGVVRMEGVGALTVPQLREFLQHTNVSVKGVVDLEEDSPVDGYEVPARMREQVLLRMPAGVFPWSGNLSRTKDLDHTIAYVPPDSGGPPGQTRIGNLGPMSRYAHRVKTHASGWRHRQPVPGVFLWRTPHGYWFRVDATGTHLLGKDPSEDDLAGRTRAPRPRWGSVRKPATRAEDRLRAKIDYVRQLTDGGASSS